MYFLGHRRLFETFKKCGIPKVAWQIDPFGHSREQAALFAQMFFDGLFLGRVDWKDKLNRKTKKELEFVWKSDPDLKSSFSQLFTGILPQTYSPPPGFCFDIACTDDPIVDDLQSREYNVPKKVSKFIELAHLQSNSYATNNIIMTMGNDFNYHDSLTWFENLDKLIFYVNERQKKGSKVNVFYSTPSCYLYSLNQANLTWTSKSDDFFPYSSDSHSYWTGFYTSRPSVKYYERLSNNFLQIVKQLQFLGQIEDEVSLKKVIQLQEAMGILQHHDAVSGTAKQVVTYDYIYILSEAIEKCKSVVNEAFNQLLSKNGHSLVQKFCFNLNISECPETEKGNNLAITIYNPLGQEYIYKVKFPVSSSDYSIFDSNGKQVQSQLFPVPSFIMNIPERKSQATHELVFNVNLPKLGFVTYFAIKARNNNTLAKLSQVLIPKSLKPIELRGKGFYAFFNPENGNILSIKLDSGLEIKFNQKFQWYKGMVGNNSEPSMRASGAYIFRPNGTAHSFNSNTKSKFFKSSNSKYSEVHSTISSFIGHVFRVYNDAEFLEFTYRIGPIPVNDGFGKEIICKFETDLKTNGTFYTDANGRHLLKRVIASSKTEFETISGNYYPINSRIVLRDEKKDLQLTVLTDRSQGGSSLTDGSLEIMVHRRLLYDDAFGVDEALNEPGVDGGGLVITGKFYIFISSIEKAAQLHRNMAQRLYLSPIITFTHCPSIDEYRNKHLTYFSELNSSLPDGIHILSLELWKPNVMLLRLEYFFETNELKNKSKSVRVSLKSLFKHVQILGMREATLSVNQLHSEARRLSWLVKDSISNEIEKNFENDLTDFAVTLKPMQIRTLLITFKSTLYRKKK